MYITSEWESSLNKKRKLLNKKENDLGKCSDFDCTVLV